MPVVLEKLFNRFDEEICRVCVHRTSRGGCTLTANRECPLWAWASDLSSVVEQVDSDRLADYLAEITQVICPQCSQDDSGRCADREHLDCPLDLYLGIVVRVLEEELQQQEA